MIALDLKQEKPVSAVKLIVESKGEKNDAKIPFSTLLEKMQSTQSKESPVVFRELLKELKDGTKKEMTFSELLTNTKDENKVTNKKNMFTLLDEKNTQKGVNIELDTSKFLIAQEDVQADTFISKSLSEDKAAKENLLKTENKELLEINPELKISLSPEKFKILIKDAKSYLKNQILSSDGFKRNEIKNLPKTLKGLTQVAQKLGVDISKITLEDVQPKEEKNIFKENGISLKNDIKNSDKTYTSANTKKVSVVDEGNPQKAVTNQVKIKHIQKNNTEDKVDIKVQNNVNKNNLHNSEPTSVLLFKVQKNPEISTEQMVSTKVLHSNNAFNADKTKKRTEDTLKLLLQGEKVIKHEAVNMTSDFSVATAKVIAPSAKSEINKSLEALLKPEITNDKEADTSTINTKTDTSPIMKADSLEVKIHEAKQMIKYLSQDVKQAINDYKAPFTRVKVQLNPQQLGEVELTVVQRGKNLHVNLSSNNAAINTLAMNANDLKVQLQNSGINNASLNFSNNSQGGEAANGGQTNQQQHNREQARSEYNYFENEEQNEEILSSLEIIVPNYA